jgi:hypothetical protein
MDRILCSILVEVLLCIRVATRLAAGYRPRDTYCRCCFILTGKMCFAEEVVVASAAIAEALALRAHVLVDEDVLLCIAVLFGLLFPAQFAAARPAFFLPSLSFWPGVPA